MRRVYGSAWLVTAAVAGLSLPARALEMDRLRVQRKEVFEFAEKPTVTQDGDRATISFASKDFCDATVAVEDATGKIIRHLASGVLGKNAPLPFKRDSLKQTIVWDGKDEIGRYVDDKESHAVRVSLGLRPQFERTLYWSGQKMADARAYPLMKAAPEGVYVFFPGHGPQLRLFDHEGNYVRTVFPFPADKIAKVPGVAWQEFPPDNERLPSKLLNHDQDTVFMPAADVREIVVAGSRIFLVSAEVAEVGTDGAGGMGLAGLNVAYPAAGYDKESETLLRPYSAAVSPDGKRLYLTAYSQLWSHYGYGMRSYGHGVSVVPLEKDGKLAPFVGIPHQKGKAAAGSDEAHFACPMSVACKLGHHPAQRHRRDVPHGRPGRCARRDHRGQLHQPDQPGGEGPDEGEERSGSGRQEGLHPADLPGPQRRMGDPHLRQARQHPQGGRGARHRGEQLPPD